MTRDRKALKRVEHQMSKKRDGKVYGVREGQGADAIPEEHSAGEAHSVRRSWCYTEPRQAWLGFWISFSMK